MQPRERHDRQGRGRGKKLKSSPLLRFCLALARDQGKTLKQIGELDLDELALWIAWYEKHDPELAKDWRAGVVAAAVANGQLKGRQRPQDFFPHLERLVRVEEQDAAAHLMAWCANVGGEVKVQKSVERRA